jgi:hypothetical protein
VTSHRTAADAAEQAELEALSERAAESRRELGETVHALAEKVAGETDMLALARRQAAHIEAGARRMALSAGQRPAAAGRRIWVQATHGPGRSARLRTAAIVGPAVVLAAVVLAAVVVVWQVRGRGHH